METGPGRRYHPRSVGPRSMSQASTPLTSEHFAYVAERTRGEDPFLQELKAAAVTAGIPAIWIAPEQASLMQILLKAAGARRVVEVGTLAGVSAIQMARAVPARDAGGLVQTIEIDPERARFAEEWIARSNVADRIEVLVGQGAERLAELPAGAFDAAFLDADKQGYARYLRECLRLVRPGGLILVDNAFAFGELFTAAPTPDVAAVRAFNDRMAATEGLHGVIVPLGDGLWVAVVEETARPA